MEDLDHGELVKNALNVFWNRVKEDLQIDPEVKNVLERLRKYYRILGVASDEYRENLELKLNHALGDWTQYFDFVVTPDETGLLKPSATYYAHVLKRTQFKPEEVLMIGDDWERDLKPAKDVGLKTVLIGPEKTGEPDFHIQGIDELESVLKQLHDGSHPHQ